MKRLTYLLIFVASFGYSQSNLVFNQVLNFRLTDVTSATVPDGKVWKVEHSNREIRATKLGVPYGSNLNYSPFNPTAGSNVIWFSEGTEISTSGADTHLSILEFDVVPVSTTSTGSGGLSSEGLEFNQVINYSNTVTTGPLGDIVDNLEVPEGKVWKITRVFLNGYAYVYPTRPYDVSNCSVELGGQNLFYRPSTSGYSNSSFENYPVWINSGTKSLIIGHGENNNKSFKISISAIEYNIPQ